MCLVFLPLSFWGDWAFSLSQAALLSVVIDKIKKRGLITSSTFYQVSANTIAFIYEQKPTSVDVSVFAFTLGCS